MVTSIEVLNNPQVPLYGTFFEKKLTLPLNYI